MAFFWDMISRISHSTSKILEIKIPKVTFKNTVKINSKFGISWILTAGHCMQNGLHTVYPDRIRIQVRFLITILGSQLRSKIYIDKKKQNFKTGMSNRFSGVGEYMGKQVHEFKAVEARIWNFRSKKSQTFIVKYLLYNQRTREKLLCIQNMILVEKLLISPLYESKVSVWGLIFFNRGQLVFPVLHLKKELFAKSQDSVWRISVLCSQKTRSNSKLVFIFLIYNFFPRIFRTQLSELLKANVPIVTHGQCSAAYASLPYPANQLVIGRIWKCT